MSKGKAAPEGRAVAPRNVAPRWQALCGPRRKV